MSFIIFSTYTDMSLTATPSSGVLLGLDLDGILKQKNEIGQVTTISGTSSNTGSSGSSGTSGLSGSSGTSGLSGSSGTSGLSGSSGTSGVSSQTVEITYNNLKNLYDNKNLEEYSFYFITDRADLGIIVYSTSTQSFSSNAYGGYLINDYQNIQSKGGWSPATEYFKFTHTNSNMIRFLTLSDTSNINIGNLVTISDFSSNPLSGGLIIDKGSGYIDYTPNDNASPNTFTASSTLSFYNNANSTTTNLIINNIQSNISSMIVGELVDVYVSGNSIISTGVLSEYKMNNLSVSGVNVDIVSSNALYIRGKSSAVTALLSSVLYYPSNSSIFVYNQNQYVLTDNSKLNGSNPSVNSNAYTLATSSLFEWDNIIYDFEKDTVLYRKDKRNNVVNSISIPYFQFGNDSVNNVIINSTSSVLDIRNNSGRITGIITGSSSVSINGNNSDVKFNIHNSTVNLNYNQGDIDIDVNNSIINANYNNGNIKATYKNNVQINHEHNSGNIIHAKFDSGFKSTLSLTQSYYHNYCNYSYNNSNSYEIIFPKNISFSNKEINNNYSTFDKTLSLTSSTLYLGTSSNWAGTIYVSSNNSSNLISNLSGFNNLPIRLMLSPSGATYGLTTSINTNNISSNDSLIMKSNNFYINTLADYIVLKKSDTPFNGGWYPLVQIDGANY